MDLQIQHDTNQITTGFIIELEKLILKLIWENNLERPKTILKK